MQDFSQDYGVALIFFNRAKPLQEVFNAVRKSKPKKLFLIQDGPRGERDVKGIEDCRKVVENIDWECEVYKNFSDENLSCDPRVFSGITWAFNHVDKLIILEDDCVPSDSFFPFCGELLEKYKNDERIHVISGMNFFDEFRGTNDSYFFSKAGAGWGWATWKRSWELTLKEKDFHFLDDSFSKKLLGDYLGTLEKNVSGVKTLVRDIESIRKMNLLEGKVYSWEKAFGITMYLSSSMIITPRVNLITNIGLTDDSTHAVNTLKKLDKKTQLLFFKKRYELDFPLKHPEYMIRNIEYECLQKKRVKGSAVNMFWRKLEGIIRRLFYSSPKERKVIFNKIFSKK